MDEQVIEERRVDDPSVSFSQFLFEIQNGANHAGTRYAFVNLSTTIGALALIRPHDPRKPNKPGREPHHERAAQRFKSEYEALYGAPAVDPSREPVDTSTRAHDAGMAHRLDKFASVRQVETALGSLAFNTLIDMLVFGTPCSAYADTMPSGQKNQRQIQLIEAERLSILDDLASMWGYRSKAA